MTIFDPSANRGYQTPAERKNAEQKLIDSGELTLQDQLRMREEERRQKENPFQRYDRMRSEYNAALKRRVSTGSIESETITWTPTDYNRDRAFELEGRRIVAAAVARLSYEDRELLERFVGNKEAMAALVQHGKMPDGLTDHWRHPIRGGGRQDVDNVCIMTVEAQEKLRELRIYPALNHAYGNMWQEAKSYLHRRGIDGGTRIVQLERYAMVYKATTGERRLPSRFSRSLEIGYPKDALVLSEVDFDLRDDLAKLRAQEDAVQAHRQRRPDRDNRNSHRPAAPHARQPRSHRTGPR